MGRSPLVDFKMEALSIFRVMINFKISKINRRANKMAHEIAKFSFDNRSDSVILNSVPPSVDKVVTDGCMNVF